MINRTMLVGDDGKAWQQVKDNNNKNKVKGNGQTYWRVTAHLCPPVGFVEHTSEVFIEKQSHYGSEYF